MSAFLERVRKYREDRGMMANLRCVLVESKKHRAWAALSRIGVGVEEQVEAFVAGLFASHPEESGTGNFGDTCKQIDNRRGASEDSKLSATEKRFQHLLSSERDEVFDRVLRMANMAKSHDIAINYEELTKDLKYWGERVKTKWAGAFWGNRKDQVSDDVEKEV